MEINNKTINLFNTDHSALFKNLMLIKDADLLLNGSFPISFFASDLDLYMKLEMNQYNKLLRELFSFLIDVDINDISELKIGKQKAGTQRKAIKLVIDELENPKYIKQDKKWVKLDLIILINGYFEEVTIIYDFGDSVMGKTIDEVTEDLIEDALKLEKEGKYYKALKRLREIYRRTGYDKEVKEINSLLNSNNVGFLYLTNARLEALKNVRDTTAKKNYVLKNLKEDLMVRLKNMFNLDLKKSDFKMRNIAKIQREVMKKLHSYVKKPVIKVITKFKRLIE